MSNRLAHRPTKSRKTRNFKIDSSTIRRGMSLMIEGIVVEVSEVIHVFEDKTYPEVGRHLRTEVITGGGRRITVPAGERVEQV